MLGCLIEKQRAVPDTYPLTLNALVSACNQSSNRWPIVAYDPPTVQRTLDGLKADGYVRFVHPAHGERTTKFRQVLDERLGLDDAETAVLAVLLLRGPQTVGELRTRTERLHPFDSLGAVQDTLDRLAQRDEPLVAVLPRAPGQKDARYTHLAGGDDVAVEAPPAAPAPAARRAGLEERVAALEATVARLLVLLGEEPDDPTA